MAAAFGVASPIAINNISRFLGVWGTDGAYLVAFFVFLLSSGLLAYCSPKSLWIAGCILFFSIAVGVFIDATLDFFLRAYDRNLWPLEILMWWVLAPVPVVLGALLGKGLARRTKG
jgi:hypothetical protein